MTHDTADDEFVDSEMAVAEWEESSDHLDDWLQDEVYMTCESVDSARNSSGRALEEAARSPELILDSGATRAAVGKEWLTSCFPQEPSASLPEFPTANRRFRFGKELVFPSLGAIKAVGRSMEVNKKNIRAIIPITATMGVVDLPLPLLLSRSSLTAVGAILYFKDKSLILNDTWAIVLRATQIGHLTFAWSTSPHNTDATGDFICTASEPPTLNWGKHRLRKTHLQLGHDEAACMIKILPLGGATSDKQLVMDCVIQCTWGRSNYQPRNPSDNQYIHQFRGEVDDIDISFRLGYSRSRL